MKKTHVLQVVGAMNTGGAEVMLMDIFRNLSNETKFSFLVNYKSKQDITKGDFDEEILNKGALIKYIPTQWSIGPFRYFKEFKKIYKELGKPEVVHIHLNAKSGIIAWAAKKSGAKKIIVHSHANLKFRGNFLYRNISRLEYYVQKFLIARYATDFWGASQEANKSLFYKKMLPKSRIINNAIDVEKFQNINIDEINTFKKVYNISHDTLVIGNVGRIVRHKNVLFIIEVLNELNKTNKDFVFIFAGRKDDIGYFNEIENKIKEYELQEKVIYLGNRNDVPLLMNVFDIYVSPALQEGFGMVALEAQAAGTLCLLFKGYPKMVDIGLNLVTFFDEFDPEKWNNKLKEYKVKINLANKMIKHAFIEKHFDIKSNVKRIEQYYKS